MEIDQLNKVLVVDTGLAGPRVEMGPGNQGGSDIVFNSSSNQAFFISWPLETNTEHSNETRMEMKVSKHKIF